MSDKRSKEEAISSTRLVLAKYLEEFKNLSREEIYQQRKKKFLDIGKKRSFTTFSTDFGNFVKKDNIIFIIKKKLTEYKKYLIIAFTLSILIVIFLFK